MKTGLLLLLATASAANWIPFDAFRFQPADEAERDPALYEIRQRAVRAAETRDLKTLLPLLSDRISSSLRKGAPSGRDEFVRVWHLDRNSRASALWDKLRDTLRLGGAFVDGEFRAPYVLARWPARFPQLDFFAVVAKSTGLHSAASEGSRVLETLGQEIVGRYDEAATRPGWLSVRAASGTTGFVRAGDVRSPADYRAVFLREKNGWRLALFASGDEETHARPE